MALPPLADVEALETWLGVTFTEGETTRAGAVLGHASSTIRSEVGRNFVDADGALIEDIPDHIVDLTVRLAARMWANPKGVTQEGTGPFNVTWGSGLLTDDERDQLSPTSPTTGGLSSVKLSAPLITRTLGWSDDDEWCEGDT